MRKTIEKVLDLLPLAVFFIAYYKTDIIHATAYLMIASLVALLLTFALTRRIPGMMIFSNLILIIFGGITVFSGDPSFIKIKPTILYLCFSSILIYDIVARKALLRHVFGHTLHLSKEGFISLSKQWLAFFLFCALLNEIIWRNFAEQTWVYFKTFGMVTLTIAFSIIQVLVIHKKLNK